MIFGCLCQVLMSGCGLPLCGGYDMMERAICGWGDLLEELCRFRLLGRSRSSSAIAVEAAAEGLGLARRQVFERLLV